MAKKQLTTVEFIEKAKKIHGDKYDYSKVKYVNTRTKICVICPKHGEFLITPNHHLSNIGCPKCAGRYKTTLDIIKEFREIHGDKYDYSKVEYKNSTTKVCIICPMHGEFWQKPSDHLSGYGCPHCRSIRKSTEKFISEANIVHNNKYDYSESVYNGCRNLIKIKCPQHGFFHQKPFKHLQGHGCPYCNESHLENDVRKLLNENGIEFQYQCGKQTFEWLGLQTLDFFLPKHNIAIECQGEQHYKPIDFFGGISGFEKTIERDKIKMNKCTEHLVKLIYVNKNDYKKILEKCLNVSISVLNTHF